MRCRPGWAYAALTLLTLLPAFVWPVPRTGDLINHWARLTLLGMGPDDPLQSLYEVRWGAIPNLGVDLLYLALSPLASAKTVARLAWALSLALPAWGAWRLHRALFARPQLGILFAPLLAYNLLTTTGLVNVAMGVGLALLILAWRVRLGPRLSTLSLLWLNLASLVLLACHIVAFGILALTLGLFEAAPRAGEPLRKSLARGLLAPRLVAAGLAAIPFLEPAARETAFSGSKLQALTAPVFARHPSDLWLLAALLLALALAARAGKLSIEAPMRAVVAALWLVVLVLPSTIGAGVLLDARLAVFAAYFSFACLRWAWRGAAAVLVPALVATLALGRVGALAPEWAAYNASVVDARAAFAALPVQARALSLRPPANACSDPEAPWLASLAPLATIDRRVFVNSVFALPGLQPVRARDPALKFEPNLAYRADLLTPEGQGSLGWMRETDWARALLRWREHFDAVILFHGRCAWRPQEPDLEWIGGAPGLSIYRLRR